MFAGGTVTVAVPKEVGVFVGVQELLVIQMEILIIQETMAIQVWAAV